MSAIERALDTMREASYYAVPTRLRDRLLNEELRSNGLDTVETHEHISNTISLGRPALIARPGGVESDVVSFFLRKRFSPRSWKLPAYPAGLRRKAELNAGIRHRNSPDLDRFSTTYLRSILSSDALAFGLFARPALSWAHSLSLQNRETIFFHDLEPIRPDIPGLSPWTLSLAGKKVLVVHPFRESILKQYENRHSISAVGDILPDFSLRVLVPPLTFAGEGKGKWWHDALQQIQEEISKEDFDVAIVGAGSYGLPIAAHAKALGKVGIHLGAVTQLLFGISGRRWEKSLPLTEWEKQGWVRPLLSETPRQARDIERGAYW